MQDQAHLSAEELKAQLAELEAHKAALAKALEAQHEQEKQTLAEEIKAMIAERGFDLEEITERVLGNRKGGRRRGRKRTAATGESNASYVRYADPDNPDNVYVRGRMPNWLTEKMTAHGFDPNSAEQRAQFKEEHLVKLAA